MKTNLKSITLYVIIAILFLLLILFLSPWLLHNYEFTIGFGVCLFLIFGLYTLRHFFSSEKREGQNLWRILTFIFFGLLISQGIIVGKKYLDKKNLRNNLAQLELAAIEKNKNLILTAEELEKQIRSESNSESLSEPTIKKIARLSHAYTPYEVFDADSLSVRIESPERASLLKMLLSYDLDSTSFLRVKKDASFQYADLEGIALEGIDLSWIDLRNTNLLNSTIRNTSFENSKLDDSNFWGAKLDTVSFDKSTMKRANMEWTDMNQVSFRNVMMDGVLLNNAQLKNARLEQASLKHAFLKGTNLNNAICEGANFFWSDLSRAKAKSADFRNCNLRMIDFTDANLRSSDFSKAVLRGASFLNANLTGVKLDQVFVQDHDWFEKLEKWNAINAENISSSYRLESEPSIVSNYVLLRR